MKEEVNLVGRRFGFLVVLRREGNMWICKCDGADGLSCGNIIEQDTYNLTHGRAVSCGCYRKQGLKEHARTGMATREDIAEVMRVRREENKQASTCRFCAEKSLTCTILRKLYCSMEICNWWKSKEEE